MSQSQPSPSSQFNLIRELYTPADIAYLLNIKSERTIWKWLKPSEDKDGKRVPPRLKGHKFRGMWRVNRRDLQEFLDKEFGPQ